MLLVSEQYILYLFIFLLLVEKYHSVTDIFIVHEDRIDWSLNISLNLKR